jgi:phosphate transport system substrate-binding protein
MSVTAMDKATEMNSWKPYQAYLLDGRYPFVRTIYALLNDPYNGLPWAFAHFLESPKGQLVIFKSGLLPVRGELNIRTVNVKN